MTVLPAPSFGLALASPQCFKNLISWFRASDEGPLKNFNKAVRSPITQKTMAEFEAEYGIPYKDFLSI